MTENGHNYEKKVSFAHFIGVPHWSDSRIFYNDNNFIYTCKRSLLPLCARAYKHCGERNKRRSDTGGFMRNIRLWLCGCFSHMEYRQLGHCKADRHIFSYNFRGHAACRLSHILDGPQSEGLSLLLRDICFNICGNMDNTVSYR